MAFNWRTSSCHIIDQELQEGTNLLELIAPGYQKMKGVLTLLVPHVEWSATSFYWLPRQSVKQWSHLLACKTLSLSIRVLLQRCKSFCNLVNYGLFRPNITVIHWPIGIILWCTVNLISRIRCIARDEKFRKINIDDAKLIILLQKDCTSVFSSN